MLLGVRIIRISSIHLLELINGQALFIYWLHVFYLSDGFVGLYFPPAVELQPYIKFSTHVNT